MTPDRRRKIRPGIKGPFFEIVVSAEMSCDHGTRAAVLIWGRDQSTFITLEVGEFTPDLRVRSDYKLLEVSQISSDPFYIEACKYTGIKARPPRTLLSTSPIWTDGRE